MANAEKFAQNLKHWKSQIKFGTTRVKFGTTGEKTENFARIFPFPSAAMSEGRTQAVQRVSPNFQFRLKLRVSGLLALKIENFLLAMTPSPSAAMNIFDVTQAVHPPVSARSASDEAVR
ncbi:MAG TPA: hypothetical protein ENJ77_01190 [Candidatus Moranbacteria bacterium]|nr:hypothetical protein [Candidatus Moranbacteria bacterium]